MGQLLHIAHRMSNFRLLASVTGTIAFLCLVTMSECQTLDCGQDRLGVARQAGDTWSPDGCNSCRCLSGGRAGCTRRLCQTQGGGGSCQEGSQYHAQDDAGQYSFGYNDGSSVKQEIKTAAGVIRGAYSYVDADGIVQNVNYIADALGFRVGATNLPVHHVDAPVEAAAPVQAAAAAPVAVAPAPVTVAASPVIAPEVSYAYLPYASNYGYSVPAAAPAPVVAPVATPAVASAPVVAAATPVDATNSQYHAQDDFGQYNYGYSDPNSVKQEVKTADGVTRGSYSYVDANGIVQTVNYISDAMGFRVAATNLPVHNVEGNAIEPVVQPEVAYAYLPYAQNYGYAAPAAA